MNKSTAISRIYRGRRYWLHYKDFTWYEECPVVKQTKNFVTVESRTYSTINYPGGMFRLSIKALQTQDKVYHSRHGEFFYLEKPDQGALFPTQQLLDTRSALDYEAMAIGWDMDQPLHELEEWQKQCYMFAKFLDQPLRKIVDRWKFGGEKEFTLMWSEVRVKDPTSLLWEDRHK